MKPPSPCCLDSVACQSHCHGSDPSFSCCPDTRKSARRETKKSNVRREPEVVSKDRAQPIETHSGSTRCAVRRRRQSQSRQHRSETGCPGCLTTATRPGPRGRCGAVSEGLPPPKAAQNLLASAFSPQ